MPLPNHQPGSPGDHRPADDKPSAARAEPSTDSTLMEGILRETIRALETKGATNQGDFDALFGVATRFKGMQLTLNPVAKELVAALFKGGFPRLAQSEELRDQISLQVAESLLGDPLQAKLLEHFWAILCEKAA
jgi:hypothetical protein